MRRIIALSATAILLSSAAMADDKDVSDRDFTPEKLQLNSAGFLFDDSLSENANGGRDDKGKDDDDRGKDQDTSDEKGEKDKDEKDDD